MPQDELEAGQHDVEGCHQVLREGGREGGREGRIVDEGAIEKGITNEGVVNDIATMSSRREGGGSLPC